MEKTRQHRSQALQPARTATIIFCLSLFLFVPEFPGQSPAAKAPGKSPVGTWVSERQSQEGLGGRWVFRADGTLSLSIGAMVEVPYKLEGDTLTWPSGMAGEEPVVLKISFRGERMCTTSAKTKKSLCLVRVGQATPGSSQIVGQWKADQGELPFYQEPASPEAQRQADARRQMLGNAILIFTPQSTLKFRLPFRTFEGTWDATTQTFTSNNDLSNVKGGKFRLENGKLILAQPDGKSDTYVRDEQ